MPSKEFQLAIRQTHRIPSGSSLAIFTWMPSKKNSWLLFNAVLSVCLGMEKTVCPKVKATELVRVRGDSQRTHAHCTLTRTDRETRISKHSSLAVSQARDEVSQRLGVSDHYAEIIDPLLAVNARWAVRQLCTGDTLDVLCSNSITRHQKEQRTPPSCANLIICRRRRKNKLSGDLPSPSAARDVGQGRTSREEFRQVLAQDNKDFRHRFSTTASLRALGHPVVVGNFN